MAESSIMWTTGGAGDGTNPYTMAQVIKWLERTLGSGIHLGYTNECEPTEAAPNVAVDSGAATIHGFPYENTAALNVNIPNTGAGDERIDRIVLRANWAAQTVRITRIVGVEAPAPVAPAITQNDGVTWDEYICQARVTDAGAITVTDERTYSDINTQIQQGRLVDGILTADAAGRLKMAAGFLGADATSRALMAADFFATDAASRAKFETDFFDTATLLDLLEADSITNAVLIDAILNGAFQADAASRALFAALFVNSAMLDNDSVTSAKIVDGAIVNVDINAAAAIAQTKISNAAPAINADQVDGFEAADFATVEDMNDIRSSVSVDTAAVDVTTNAFTDLTVMTLTPTLEQTCDVLIILTLEHYATGAGTKELDVRAEANAVTLDTYTEHVLPTTGNYISTFHWFATAVPAGARNFKIEWKCLSGADVEAEQRTLSIIIIPQ